MCHYNIIQLELPLFFGNKGFFSIYKHNTIRKGIIENIKRAIQTHCQKDAV